MHPEEDAGDEQRHRANDRPKDAAVRIRVVQAVPHPPQLSIVERSRVDGVPERPGGLHRHGDQDGGPRGSLALARTTDGDCAAECRLAFVERERRREEVFGLHSDPLERSVEERALIGTNAGKIGALRLGRLRDDRVVSVVVQRILLHRAQPVREIDEQHRATAAKSGDRTVDLEAVLVRHETVLERDVGTGALGVESQRWRGLPLMHDKPRCVGTRLEVPIVE